MQESLSYTQDKKTQTFYFNAQPKSCFKKWQFILDNNQTNLQGVFCCKTARKVFQDVSSRLYKNFQACKCKTFKKLNTYSLECKDLDMQLLKLVFSQIEGVYKKQCKE